MTKISRFIVLPSFLLDLLSEGKLKHSDVILLGVISGLSVKEGFCKASNKKLAEFSGLSRGTVANKLIKYRKIGLIEIEIIRDEKNQVKERKIFLKFDIHPLHWEVNTPIHSEMNTSSSESEEENKDDNKNFSFKEKRTKSKGREEINFILEEIEKALGFLPPSRFGSERKRAWNLFQLLQRRKDREFLDDDWRKNLKHFLETVQLVRRRKKIQPEFFETLYSWYKNWLAKKGKELFGVQSPWYVRWKRQKEIEETQGLLGELPPKVREMIQDLANQKTFK